MNVYQLHLDGVNRAKTTFKSEQDALNYQSRLIRYIKDRIAEGQLGFREYLAEAKRLELVTVKINTRIFSIIEHCETHSGVVRNYKNRKEAERELINLRVDSDRVYSIMESKISA